MLSPPLRPGTHSTATSRYCEVFKVQVFTVSGERFLSFTILLHKGQVCKGMRTSHAECLFRGLTAVLGSGRQITITTAARRRIRLVPRALGLASLLGRAFAHHHTLLHYPRLECSQHGRQLAIFTEACSYPLKQVQNWKA